MAEEIESIQTVDVWDYPDYLKTLEAGVYHLLEKTPGRNVIALLPMFCRRQVEKDIIQSYTSGGVNIKEDVLIIQIHASIVEVKFDGYEKNVVMRNKEEYRLISVKLELPLSEKSVQLKEDETN